MIGTYPIGLLVPLSCKRTSLGSATLDAFGAGAAAVEVVAAVVEADDARVTMALITGLGTFVWLRAISPSAEVSKPFFEFCMAVMMTVSSMPACTILMTSALVMGAALSGGDAIRRRASPMSEDLRKASGLFSRNNRLVAWRPEAQGCATTLLTGMERVFMDVLVVGWWVVVFVIKVRDCV